MIVIEKFIFMGMLQLLTHVNFMDILIGVFLQKIILAYVNQWITELVFFTSMILTALKQIVR